MVGGKSALLGWMFGAFSIFHALADTNLSTDEYQSIDEAGRVVDPGEQATPDRSTKRWYERMELEGDVAGSFMIARNDRSELRTGRFGVDEVLLNFDAQPWQDVSVNIELYPIWWVPFSSFTPVVGSAFLKLDGLVTHGGNKLLGIKVGRFDLPFGEDYLWQQVRSNPILSRSAAWFWGWDEGVELYGSIKNLGWILAVTDGSSSLALDDHVSKAINVKLYGNFLEAFSWSASYMSLGLTNRHAMWQGFRRLGPVLGTAGALAGGHVVELDLKYSLGQIGTLALQGGRAFLTDVGPDQNRALTYFTVEPRVNFLQRLYALVRYSGIGTLDKNLGYTLNDGVSATSIDNATSFTRLTGGIGYQVNPRVTLMAELSYDEFSVTPGAVDPGGNRYFVGARTVATF